MTALARSIHARASRVPARQFVADFEVPEGMLASRRQPAPVPTDLQALFPFGVMRCHYCGCRMYRLGSAEALADPNCGATRDHVVPRCDGGEETVPCCALCNGIKGDDPYEMFVAFMRWPDARDPATRKAAYRQFRVEIIKIGLAAFEEEVARMTGGRRDG